ncbi:type II/IV secretion system protein [Candidatus Parcubacteria bacterium]|nr:type II/IV secretion system protein [Candidatus Parcubacteria bacterium]
MNLIQQLIKKKIIDNKQAVSLETEVKSSGKTEEQVILERKVVSENFLFRLKSESLKIPLKEVAYKEIPLKILEFIPEESAKYYKIVSLAMENKILEVGMVYPENIKAKEALKFLARQNKFSYKTSLITLSDFNKLLKQYRSLKGEVKRALVELEDELKVEPGPAKAVELERLVEDAPIIKVVAVILKHAVEGKASDIHIEPTRDKLRVRFRLDGILHSSILLPLRIHPAVIARLKIISNLRIDETRVPQDGRFSIRAGDKTIDFRISTFPTTLGEKVAIRVLNPEEGLKDFASLGLTGRDLRVLEKVVKKPCGMILATGPTGCGKSTTLYTILRKLNKEGVNIATLEDPVEYYINGVNQSQIKPEIGYTFSQGLRSLVRQDPDIIMVGEIRDEESAALAIHAALTGHLVLSTLHTTSAIGVIPRLVDMEVKKFLIAPTLSVVIAQRLVRSLCPNCKKKIKPGKEVADLIWKEIKSLSHVAKKELSDLPVGPDSIHVYEAKGCKKCNFKGIVGRLGIYEVLEMTDSLEALISQDLSEAKILAEAKNQGMTTMRQDGMLKVLAGLTSIEEILRVAE